ncbi:myotilin isoform X1 [Ornithorhynchus anatinus]|uniref:myotilin isoform X1 n=1 Tax=Ornithorhynchus anatinus TaxID=9258 RepID=UPI0019D4528F|nr:myotilin isoform X1 [Ornithorhynchus anatinus]
METPRDPLNRSFRQTSLEPEAHPGGPQGSAERRDPSHKRLPTMQSPPVTPATLATCAGWESRELQDQRIGNEDFRSACGNSSMPVEQGGTALQERPSPSLWSCDPSQEGQQNLSSDPQWLLTRDPSSPCVDNTSPPVASMYQPSMFNYERPKHFLHSQNTCGTRMQPPGTETSMLPSNPTKQSSILIQPRQCTEQRFSSSSSVSSRITVSSSTFPTSAQQPAGSFPGQRVSTSFSQSPAGFLSSILPSQPDYNSSRGPSAVEPNYRQSMPTQAGNPKPMQIGNAKPILKIPDHEIQGSKEALIQDLERKLRCKDSLLHNGNQRLTYEEKMARRLLGPQNAAAVLDTQNDHEAQDFSQQPNSENVRLQVPSPQVRSRSSSRGAVNDQDSIQEKFYPPRFVQVPENLSIEEGRFCRIDFKVSGLPAPDVTWYLNGAPVHSDDFHKMIVSEKGFHSLIFEVVRASDAGAYACVATNRAGEATFTVQLDVLAKEHRRAPIFIFKPQSKKVYEGESVKLECQISATPPPKLFWKRNNEMVQFNTDRISLYHDNSGRITLLIKDVTKKDAGWYTVSAVNEAGVTTCNTRLDVAAIPNQTLPNPKQLRVRPTFSKYLALNGRGLDVKQAFNPEGEFQRLAAQSGLYESEEL